MATNIDFINKKQNIALGLMIPFNNPIKGVFALSYTTRDQMISNFKNLLLTARGERIYQPNFGTNIQKLLFEPNVDDITPNIIDDITSATLLYCPYVNIQKITVRNIENSLALVIDILFNLINTPYLETLSLNINQYGEVQI